MSTAVGQVIFADGTFIDGSTSELSCDGPLREPFVAFCQVRPKFQRYVRFIQYSFVLFIFSLYPLLLTQLPKCICIVKQLH